MKEYREFCDTSAGLVLDLGSSSELVFYNRLLILICVLFHMYAIPQ